MRWRGSASAARSLDWTSRALTVAPDGPLTQYNAACDYVLLGEKDKALDILERWAAHANPATKIGSSATRDFDPIREHPRFQALLAQIG